LDASHAVSHNLSISRYLCPRSSARTQIPATVSFRAEWRATGAFEQRGSGATVPPEDPAAFLGDIAPARSTARCSGEEWGFSFRSDRASTDRGYAQIGRSRNGVFL